MFDPSLPSYQHAIRNIQSVPSDQISPQAVGSISNAVIKDVNTNSQAQDPRKETINLQCATIFRVFLVDKEAMKKKKDKSKKIWVPVGPEKTFPAMFTISPTTTFEDFVKLVAAECEGKMTNSGGVIVEAWKSGSPDLEWAVTIPRVEGFLKKHPFILKTDENFQTWVNTLANLGRTEAGLSLLMANPNKEAKKAHQEALLAKQRDRAEAARQLAAAKLLADSDAESDASAHSSDNEADDIDTIKTHMREIYSEHACNSKYDRNLPVYIHPSDDKRYILLSNENVKIWARAMIASKEPGNEGVSVHSPPKCLKYMSVSSSKRKRTRHDEVAQALIRYLKGNDSGHSGSSDICSSGAPSIDDEAGIREYVEFIGLRNPNAIIETLINNDIDSHKIFKSRTLADSVLLSIGLTVGVVAQLRDNVGKFEKFLARRHS